MVINYWLIGLSFLAPVVKILWDRKSSFFDTREVIIDWVGSGLMGCLVQFAAYELPFFKQYEFVFTILFALFGKIIYIFAKENIPILLYAILRKKIKSNGLEIESDNATDNTTDNNEKK